MLFNCFCMFISMLLLYFILGLSDFVDFLFVLFVVIVSYFFVEVISGMWKLVMLNGMDWLSLVVIFLVVELEMKEVFVFVGVYINICLCLCMLMFVCVICSFFFRSFMLL